MLGGLSMTPITRASLAVMAVKASIMAGTHMMLRRS